MRHLPLLFLLPLALLAAPLAWDAPSHDLLDGKAVFAKSKAVTREAYPDADAVELDSHLAIRYEADGKFIQVNDFAVKVLTEAGRDGYRVVSSWYSASYSRAKIAKVEIYKPSGKVVPVDLKRSTREMIDDSQMSSNIYDPSHKIIQVAVANLEPGDVLRCVLVDETFHPRVPNSFSDYHILESTNPIRHALVTIDAPAALPLRSVVVKDQIGKTLASSVEKDARRIRYRWEASDVPQAFPEPRSSDMYLHLQRVCVSTFTSWQEVSKWYYNLASPHFKLTPEIQAEVQRITKGLRTPDEKLRAVFAFVSQKIRYMGIIAEDTAPGYEPHDVSRTFTQRAGVCRDKAALLAAMLGAAGFDAFPVLINAGAKKDPEVPMPYFNHAITAVRDRATGKYQLMDSTDETTRDLLPAYLSDKSFLVATPEGDTLRTTPVAPAEENLVFIRSRAAIGDDGALTLAATIEFHGINDNAYRGTFLQQSPEERRQFFEKLLASRFPGMRLQGLRLEPENLQDTTLPLRAELTLRAPDFLITALGRDGKPDTRPGAHALLRLPRLSTAFGMVNFIFRDATLAKRRFPYYSRYACGVHEDLEVTLPGRLRAVATPSYPEVDNDALSWRTSLQSSPGRLLLHSEFASKVASFSPAQYASLKQLLRQQETALERKPVFAFAAAAPAAPEKAADKPAPDLVILDLETTVTLESLSAWTRVTRVRLQPLTYSGVKEISDLDWSYNPAWEELQIKSARVTNGKKTQEVTPEMIHLMDAPWVGSAPRYPAGKTLVVNFPGVAVGSVIEYELVQTCRQRPFFSARLTPRTISPVGHWAYHLIAPKALNIRHKILQNGWLDLPPDTKCPPVDHVEYKLKDGRVRHSWFVNDLPQVAIESATPPPYASLPTVVLATDDWDNYARAIARVVASLGDGGKTIQAIAAPFRKLAPEPRLAAIRDWVEQNIRCVGPDFHDLPLSCLSRPETTARDGYGHSADCAILYQALLKAAGFQEVAIFLATSTSRIPDLQEFHREFPSRSLFSNWIVRVECDGREVWLNDQDHYAQFGTCAYDQGLLLSLRNGGINRLRLKPPFVGEKRTTELITIRPDGSARDETIENFYGTSFGTHKRLYARMTPEERRRHYQKLLADISQNAVPVLPDLQTDFQHYPGRRSYVIDIKDFAIREGDHLHFTLPVAPAAALADARTDQRSNPLYWSSFRRSTRTITVRLPEQYPKILLKPADFVWTAPNNAGTIAWTCRETVVDGRTELIFTLAQELAPAVFTPAQYPVLQEARRRLQHPSATTILLGK